jgi:hypothetical protein
VADEALQEARERAEPLLADVALDRAELELIFSLVEAEDEEVWLRERLADALRD